MIYWEVLQGSTSKRLQTSNFDSATWTHIIITVKDTTCKVYKNSVLVGTQTDGHEPNVLTRTNHIIGAGAAGNYLDGTIGYLKVWHNKELSDSDVDALYNCPSGTSGDSIPSSCDTCPIGKYSTFPDTLTCSNCPGGKTTTASTDPSDRDSSDDCSESCAPGTYSNDNALRRVTVTACLPCEAGKYQPNLESSSCIDCDTGKYSPPGATISTSCQQGKYSESTGDSAACQDCQAGSYTSTGGR